MSTKFADSIDLVILEITFSSAGQLVASQINQLRTLVGQLDALQVLLQWLNEHLHRRCVLLQHQRVIDKVMQFRNYQVVC